MSTGPSPPLRIGGDSYFQGRTIVFKSDEELLTMVHELTHALGMAHNCGNKDWRSPLAAGGRHTCVMTYDHYWVLGSPDKQLRQREPIRWSAGDTKLQLCAPHILAIRKAELADDSPGRRLGWNR
jgi:hypothetical protein